MRGKATFGRAAILALPGAAAITVTFAALGLTGPLGEPVTATRIEGRVATIAVGTRPLIPGCGQVCSEPGKALGVLKEYKLQLSGVPGDFEIHRSELRPAPGDLTSAAVGEQIGILVDSGTHNVIGLERQATLHESYAMRHPEMRLLWQALFVLLAFEISFLITLMFVMAGRPISSGVSRPNETEVMLLALITNYVVSWGEYFRLHGLLGGPVGYGQLATALNLSWFALGFGAASILPVAWYFDRRRTVAGSDSSHVGIAVLTSLAVTLLTSVLPFELLIHIDTPP